MDRKYVIIDVVAGILLGMGCVYTWGNDGRADVQASERVSNDSIPIVFKEGRPAVGILDEKYEEGNNIFPRGTAKKIYIQEMKEKVMREGDEFAYDELAIYYINVHYYPQEFLYYSLLMATKYDNSLACYRVFNDLYELYHQQNLGEFEPPTRRIALGFLNRGAEKGEYHALERLMELYLKGDIMKKDSIKAMEIDSIINKCQSQR